MLVPTTVPGLNVRVAGPPVEPIVKVVAAPPMFSVVATVSHNFCTACAPTTVPGNVKVPPEAPIAKVVAAPPMFSVVAVVLIRENVVLAVVIDVVIAGLVPNNKTPEPVSSVIAAAKFAEEGVAKNVATLVPNPETPVEIGRPVQLVNVPEDGVPSTGVVRVGLVKVLFVSVSVVARPTNVSVASGNVIVLSAVGSITDNVVSNASAVDPSKTILLPFIVNPANIGLLALDIP